MYGVETKRLNEQVRRNIERFPIEFCFQLSKEELTNLKSQFATSRWGGRKKDLGKKWFAFSKMDKTAFSLFEKLKTSQNMIHTSMAH